MELDLSEPELEHTRNSCMPGMLQELWVERILVVAYVGLEIQVVLGVLVVMEERKVPKQPPHLLKFYGEGYALVVVGDPLSTKENSYLRSINIRIGQHDYKNIAYIH